MADYNEVATSLLVPFDESEISQRLQNPNKEYDAKYNKIFTYVTPERYRYRLLQAFKYGFEFGIVPGSVVFGKDGIFALYRFVGEVADEGVKYDITVPAFEDFTTSTSDPNKKLNMPQMMNILSSQAVKNISLNIGLGLHLYDKQANQVSDAATASKASAKPNTAAKSTTTNAKAAPVAAGDWSGEATISFGKHKGTKYSEIEESYIDWLCDKKEDREGNPAPDQNALKERARRNSSNAGDAESTASASTDEEAEFPF